MFSKRARLPRKCSRSDDGCQLRLFFAPNCASETRVALSFTAFLPSNWSPKRAACRSSA
jgi:hypothetical protein